jgi:hypothetical protein
MHDKKCGATKTRLGKTAFCRTPVPKHKVENVQVCVCCHDCEQR